MYQKQNVSYLAFPKNDPIRCAKWIENCGLSISVDDVVKKRYSVCGKHFETYMFLNDLKNRLQPHSSYLYYLMMRP
ncbi:52 kDa repressor of the inhibitor of the protein kinase-like [Acyrthosiphon pisum]|uniref:THAP-type domain-containing protein n=1 Tax=Acyrthosiphon pisum TaxID=7029 RepID=A0A8R1W7B3_ACYPI|nr:52 kDa repressor of the inhibitor of the protein kinase-like [Acyrthosiphon pisum]|eukprot:XP_003240784.1 PREDICTED: 52 kDa repressor of the inhibitor of the protein kinase-like isoform X2 [Acyrthosiphon pisum]